MKLASWIYWDLAKLGRAVGRRALVQLVRKTGIDIAMCIWSAPQIIAGARVIAALGDELAGEGAELHVGICPLAAESDAGVPRSRLYQFVRDGKRQYGNLCPSWPQNRELVVAVARRVCQAIGAPSVAGLHLDFIRYLFSAGVPWKLEWESGREWIDTYHWCDCAACRSHRQSYLGRPDVTAYDRDHPGVIFKEMEFRKRNVEEVFGGIVAVTREAGKALSIAQRVQYLNRAVLEGQDWMEWAARGVLAFTCPMNYATSTDVFRARMEQNMPRLAHRGQMKLYEGVSRRSSAGESSIQTVLQQMSIALELGADGVTLFHLGVLQPGEHETIRRWKRQHASR